MTETDIRDGNHDGSAAVATTGLGQKRSIVVPAGSTNIKGLQMWMGKKHREAHVSYSEQVIRKHALRRLADVFQVPEASLSLDDSFGEELKAAPATDFRSNEFDTLDEDIKWVADKPLLQAMARGNLVIHTVGDYCDHMVRCSQINNTRVAEILKLPAPVGQSTDPGA